MTFADITAAYVAEREALGLKCEKDGGHGEDCRPARRFRLS